MKSTIHELQKRKIFRVSKNFIALLILLVFFTSYSQNGTCGGQFTDSGGVNGNYQNNENQIITICPANVGNVVTITFTQFDIEPVNDKMLIYDGITASPSPLIASNNPNGAFWGSTIPGPFTATNPAGCLTFVFLSNAVTNRAGWVANVTCGPAPGFNLNAYLDNNGDGDQDSEELNFPFGSFNYQKNNGTLNNIISSQSNYYLFENNPANNYNFGFAIDPAFSSYYNVVNPNINNLNVGTVPSLIQVNFPVTVTNNLIDLGVNLIPVSAPRAGFNHTNRISYTNNGNQLIANGTISFTNNVATTIFATSQTVSSSSSGFTYDFSNLLPFETRFIDVTLSIPSIPTVNIGQMLTNSVTVTTTATEPILSNNNFTLSEAVIASYDPNDITESHGGKILFSSFNVIDYLNYTIRFENTGTAFAENVSITNLLDPKIDENSIQIVASSNNCVLNRVGSNLNFKFDDIFLPVSVANTTTGKGYVTYKAKLKPGFAVGSIIPNSAKIYFDINPAIDTNVFETEFVSLLSNSSFDYNEFAKIYPNPTKNTINIETQLNNNIESISIYNLLGQLFLETNQSNTKSINISQLQTGTYIMKIKSNFGFSNVKFIKE